MEQSSNCTPCLKHGDCGCFEIAFSSHFCYIDSRCLSIFFDAYSKMDKANHSENRYINSIRLCVFMDVLFTDKCSQRMECSFVLMEGIPVNFNVCGLQISVVTVDKHGSLSTKDLLLLEWV